MKNEKFKHNKLQVANDVAEDVTNHRAEQQEDGDDDDSYQNQDESVFNQALAFFAGEK